MHTLRRRGSLPPAELAASLDGYVVVDIRDRSEWTAGHIAGSVHVPLDEIGGAWDDRDPHLPVAVFANDHEDALHAVGILHAAGRDAVIVSGGARKWRAQGHSLVTNKTD